MQSVRFIHSLALLCTHTVSVCWWLYNHVGILRQDLSPNNVVYWIIKEMKEAEATNAGTHGTLTDYNLLLWTASLGPWTTWALLGVTRVGLSTGYEFVDVISLQYTMDLVSYPGNGMFLIFVWVWRITVVLKCVCHSVCSTWSTGHPRKRKTKHHHCRMKHPWAM